MMYVITVTDHQGQECSGQWNGKTYKSKVEDREELYRIYLDKKEIHITYEELDRLTNIAVREKNKRRKQVMDDFLGTLAEYDIEDKMYVLAGILCDEEVNKSYRRTEEWGAYDTLLQSVNKRVDNMRYL